MCHNHRTVQFRKSTKRMLERINADEGLPIFRYDGCNGYAVIRDMKEAGLVSVIYDNYHRVHRVFLTDKGRAVLEHIRQIDDCMEGDEWFSSELQLRSRTRGALTGTMRTRR